MWPIGFSKPTLAILSIVLLVSLTVSAHATPTYVAGVSLGDYAYYVPVKAVFHSSNPLIPEPQYLKDLNATALSKLTVTAVSSPGATNVTVATRTLFKSGTSTSGSLSGDLETGKGNLTFSLIAGGLSHPEPIWNNATAPTINETTSMNFLGATRIVNIVNITTTLTISGIPVSLREYFVWDQMSGIALKVIGSGSFFSIAGTGDFYLEVAITSTNVFSGLPADFQITAVPNSVTVLADQIVNSTITIIPLNGFDGDVVLSISVTPITLSSGLPCTLSATTITGGYGTSKLSCSGRFGENAVTVTGTSVTQSHSVLVQVTVQDYSISVSPSDIMTNPGTAGTSTITITSRGGFDGTVNLASSVNHSGLTCTLTPTSLSTGSGASILSCSGSTGTYTVTIMATSGSLSHTSQVSVSVVSNQPAHAANTILGLDPTLFYAIVGTIAVVVGAVTALALRGRKAGPQPSLPSPASSTV